MRAREALHLRPVVETEAPLASGHRPHQAFSYLGRVGFIAWRLSHPILREMPAEPRYLYTYQAFELRLESGSDYKKSVRHTLSWQGDRQIPTFGFETATRRSIHVSLSDHRTPTKTLSAAVNDPAADVLLQPPADAGSN